MNFPETKKLYYGESIRWRMIICISVLILIMGCSEAPEKSGKDNAKHLTVQKVSTIAKKKVLFVNSYHRGYDWSDGVTRGILDTFDATMKSNGEIDNSESKVTLKIFYMDTKRNKSEEFKKNAGLKAKGVIGSWKPDIVIASDDNAAKYLIVPYYKNSKLPFIFCAINWDASIYGFPSDNVTGMVEITVIKPMLEHLKEYAEGNRIGLLGADTLTRKKSAAIYSSYYKLDIDNRYAATFKDWKREFEKLQDEVDMMLITSPAGISGWDQQAAVQFVLKNAKIPSGCMIPTAMPFSLIGFTKVPEEQGEWAAGTALDILAGKSPKDIPVVTNKKAQVYLNMRLAKKLGIKFPMELIERARFVEEEWPQ